VSEKGSGDLTSGELDHARLLHYRAKSRAPHTMSYLNASSRITKHSYAIKQRVKNIAEIASKVRRKRNEKKYEVEDVKDALGIRLVTLYRRDMTRLLDAICDLVNEGMKPEAAGFRFCGIARAKIYDSGVRRGKSMSLAQAAQEMIKGKFSNIPSFPCEILGPDPYSSIHLILAITPAPGEVGEPNILIEVQIRSVFEDTWGEIEHRRYESERESPDLAAKRLEQGHLEVLKLFLDASAAYADLLAPGMVEGEPAEEARPPGITPTLDEQGHYDNILKAVGVADAVIRDVTMLVEEKQKLDAQDLQDGNGQAPLSGSKRRERYSRMADEFQAYFDKSNARGELARPDKGDKRTLRFILKMEEALCHFLVGTDEHIYRAKSIYEALRTEFPKSITLHFRLGEVLGKLQEGHEALESGEGALEILQQARDLLDRNEADPYELSYQQRRYIGENLPRVIGMAHYRKSLVYWGERNKIKQLECLADAYNTTHQVFGVPDAKLDKPSKLRNNLLHYATQYYEVSLSLPAPRSTALGTKEISENLAELEKLVDWENETEPRNIDTIAYAKAMIQRSGAAEAAKRAVDLLLWQTNPHPSRAIDERTKGRMLMRLINIQNHRPPSDGIAEAIPPSAR
jgi:ppGpp synthetase/RelA/SpoT-type nucleotidyltranferase